MKSKKLLLLASAVLSVCFILSARPFAKVSAAGDVTDKIGYDNPFDYCEDLDEVDSIDFTYHGDTTLPENLYNFDREKKTIYYNASLLGETIKVVLHYTDTTAHPYPLTMYVRLSDTVEEQLEVIPDNVIKTDPTDLTARDNIDDKIQKAVESAEEQKEDHIHISYLDLQDMVYSPVLAKKDLTVSAHVCSPSSTWAVADSGKLKEDLEINLSKSGFYKVYFTYSDGYTDPLYKVEDLTEKADGFYDEDTLIYPIFSFDFVKSADVKVTFSGVSGKVARKDMKYSSVTVSTANVSDVEYSLQYSTDGTNWNTATDAQAKLDDGFALMGSSLNFTPLVDGGYFRVCCMAKDVDGNEVDAIYSADITVKGAVEAATYDKEVLKNWFKNNWQSVIFLGIALLCLVGIVIVALYKPKDKQAKVKIDDNQAEEAEEAVEEPSEEVPAEETAEEPSEEVPAEETVEAPAEEVPAEETAEEPAEEVPAEETVEAPAEEVPAEETVEAPADEVPSEETAEAPTDEVPAEETAEAPADEKPDDAPKAD